MSVSVVASVRRGLCSSSRYSTDRDATQREANKNKKQLKSRQALFFFSLSLSTSSCPSASLTCMWLSGNPSRYLTLFILFPSVAPFPLSVCLAVILSALYVLPRSFVVSLSSLVHTQIPRLLFCWCVFRHLFYLFTFSYVELLLESRKIVFLSAALS